MACNQRDFRKDKPKPLRVRIVCGVKTLTIFPKEKEMKTTKMVVILVLALGLTTEVANADFTFGTPTNLGPTVNGPDDVLGVSISFDGLELYFCSDRPGGYGGYDLWMATRPTIDDDWSAPMNLGPTVNSQSDCMAPSISADGLTLYFSDYDYGPYLPGGFGSTDTWMVTRQTVDAPWSSPVNLGQTVNWGGGDNCPNISADGLSLYFGSSGRRGAPGASAAYDLWLATRTTTDDEWGAPKNLGPSVNTPFVDTAPSLSSSGLVLFFCSDRTGGQGDYDIWMIRRVTKEHSWSPPVNLGTVVNSSAMDGFPSISANGSTLYFCSARPGGFGGLYGDIWQVSIEPVVDLNGDGIVNSADMCIMVDYWGTDEPLCDIGPTPFGDGIVDVQDLIVLAEHLFTYPGAVAYWKLDETEGDIAHDSVGVYDGILNGAPTWQPTSGMIDGALELDGINDYVSTDFVLNPEDGSFSVFVWINGGAPGQVVISQKINAGGLNWLSADPLDGKLMTELKGTGRGAAALLSQTVITDGDWHRVGFVRDGSDRILYVDDIEVARDTATNLESASGGLYIGAGSDLEQGAFWSGLIDDVRIYNRAVTP